MQNSAMTISYKLGGGIAEDYFVELFQQLALIAKKDRKMNLVLEIYQIDGLRKLNAFLSNERSREIAQVNLRKFALIADADWIDELGNVIDFNTNGMEVKVFGRDEREKANSWVQSSTKQEDIDLETRLKQGYAHLLV